MRKLMARCGLVGIATARGSVGAYRAGRKPFPFTNGIWLLGDYGTAARSKSLAS